MSRCGDAATLGQVKKTDLKREEGAGTKEDVGPGRSPSSLDRREMQRDGTRDRRCKEVDRGRPVMAERKADLTVVVRLSRRRIAAWRVRRQDGRRAMRDKR